MGTIRLVACDDVPGIGGEEDGWEPITVAEFARQMAELAKQRDSGAVEILTFRDAAYGNRNNATPEHTETNHTRSDVGFRPNYLLK